MVWGAIAASAFIKNFDFGRQKHADLSKKMNKLMQDMKTNQENIEKFRGTALEGYYLERKDRLLARLKALMPEVEAHNDGATHSHGGGLFSSGHNNIQPDAAVLRGYYNGSSYASNYDHYHRRG